MNKIGIKIDLSTFFDDERKMGFVMVNPDWENVECLQKRVEFLFDVDSVRFLNSDGLFLPPQESIEIVKFCSGLKAFVPKDSLERRKKKRSKKSKCDDETSEIFESETNHCDNKQEEDHTKKKRKYCSVDNGKTASQIANDAKRLKNCVNVNDGCSQMKHVNKSTEITSTSEQTPMSLSQPELTIVATSNKISKSKKCKKSKASTTNLDHKTAEIEAVQNVTNSDEVKTTCNEEMNKQIKMLHTSTPKETSGTDNEDEKSSNDDVKSSVGHSSRIPSSTFPNESKMMGQKNLRNSNNPFRKLSSDKGHIHFNEAGEIVSTTTKTQSKNANNISKTSKTVVIFRCPLQDVTKKDGGITSNPRIFHIKRHSSDSEKQKQLIEIRENLILPPIPKLSEENNISLSLVESEATEVAYNEKSIDIPKGAVTSHSLTEVSALSNYTETTTVAKNDILTADNSVKVSQTPNKENSKNSVNLSIDSESGDDSSKLSEKKCDLSKSERETDTSLDVEEISEIIDLNETEDNCNSTVNDLSLNSSSLDDIRINKILPFCTAMSDLPNIGDIIVFKMTYVNKKRNGLTKYIAGKVEYINKRTKAIKMLIVDGLSELYHIPDNYIANLDQSQDNIRYLQVKKNDMIEPKVYSVSK